VTAPPFVSVIIPCRNEEAFIDRCLTSVRSGDFPRDRMEVLVVDGMSDDRTREIVERRAAEDDGIALLDNPGRIAPTALNIGIRRAKGDIIVRVDAHALYGRDYISKLVDWLTRSGADNVGGVWLTRPANATPRARAIAIGLAHPFGVGNAHFRIGVREPRWVDTVPFGCYRREVFDRIGLFDEDLVRNQDDEFNARLIRRGGRILLVPEIVAEYFARESMVKLWRTYFQYGYFKPLAARKIGAVMTIRQLIPALFVTTVSAGASLAALFAPLRPPFAAVIGTYAAADLACAAFAGRRQGIRCVLWLAVVFPVLHVAYGLGFLKGLADFVARDQRTSRRAIAPTR
jgi:glycosyltransferase involved in cell wall biosynthesis